MILTSGSMLAVSKSMTGATLEEVIGAHAFSEKRSEVVWSQVRYERSCDKHPIARDYYFSGELNFNAKRD